MRPVRCALPLGLGLALLLLAGCATTRRGLNDPPPAPREFRGVWVATVSNIDWPSRPGLAAAQQQAEMNAILDRAQALHLNAVILQVRPAADALYRSELEPWSEYLTGRQGGDPGYDPLAAWISGAHRRGLELHAWFNPYRARHQHAKSAFDPTHLARTHPDAVKQYGELWWMDPGDAVARQRTLDVIADVVRRYDVDGVHLDDYFYPYPISVPRAPGAPVRPEDARATVDFPDGPSWQKYRDAGGRLERADWRRQNVDQLVEEIHRTVHAIKPWVLFGISPFGLGRPDLRPAGIEGFSQYDQLYANVELWVGKGWLDYLTPQLYWPRDRRPQAFAVLLDYWAAQNTARRHLWPGLFASAIDDSPKSWTAEEIVQQIHLARTRPAAGGHVLFSMVALLQDRRGLAGKLRAENYPEAALVPPTPWLDDRPPARPALRRQPDGRLLIVPGSGEPAARYAVWRRYGSQWRFSVQSADDPVVALAPDPALGAVAAVVVSAVDRRGNESPRATLVPVRPAGR